jgi:hypothetical protein
MPSPPVARLLFEAFFAPAGCGDRGVGRLNTEMSNDANGDGVLAALAAEPEPEIHRADPESGSTRRLFIGIFSQTAGLICEFWVNPVNFTFRRWKRPAPDGVHSRRPDLLSSPTPVTIPSRFYTNL